MRDISFDCFYDDCSWCQSPSCTHECHEDDDGDWGDESYDVGDFYDYERTGL